MLTTVHTDIYFSCFLKFLFKLHIWLTKTYMVLKYASLAYSSNDRRVSKNKIKIRYSKNTYPIRIREYWRCIRTIYDRIHSMLTSENYPCLDYCYLWIICIVNSRRLMEINLLINLIVGKWWKGIYLSITPNRWGSLEMYLIVKVNLFPEGTPNL